VNPILSEFIDQLFFISIQANVITLFRPVHVG